jgi:hypothetical protein
LTELNEDQSSADDIIWEKDCNNAVQDIHKYQCQYCSRIFSTEQSFRSHVLEFQKDCDNTVQDTVQEDEKRPDSESSTQNKLTELNEDQSSADDIIWEEMEGEKLLECMH